MDVECQRHDHLSQFFMCRVKYQQASSQSAPDPTGFGLLCYANGQTLVNLLATNPDNKPQGSFLKIHELHKQLEEISFVLTFGVAGFVLY